ncbi:MAG: O-antigen ligase family protein [Clostridiales bacterium]|jgi:O-antigen ligase|nr:O-antigen ligase family protein [Clostridiales bacterium]
MNTKSIVIKWIIAFFSKLNYYFEYSFLYKIFLAIGKASRTSVIVKSLSSDNERDYTKGSGIFSFVFLMFIKLSILIKTLYLYLARINANSLNKRIFDSAIEPLKSGEGITRAVCLAFCGLSVSASAGNMIAGNMAAAGVYGAILLVNMAVLINAGLIAKAIIGCVPVRVMGWFFTEEKRPEKAFAKFKGNRLFYPIYFIIGFLAGLLFFVLPFKMAAVVSAFLIFALGFVVCSFYYPIVSYAAFFAGMAVIPSQYWNNALIILAAVFYAGVYFIQWLHGKNDGLNIKYITQSLMLFVLFCVVSLFTGFGGMDSVRVFAILFGCIIHSVLLSNIIKNKENMRVFIFMLTGAIALTALFGMYQYYTGIEIRSEFTDLSQSQGLARLFSTMGNPNNDAEYWVMALPFTIAMICVTKSDVKRLILAGAVGLCLIALMYTYSRSGYLALLGAAGVFVWIMCPRLVPVGIIALVLMIPFLPQSLMDRVMTIGQDTSSTYRVRIWEGVMRILSDFWVQGIGIGPSAFNIIYRDYASTAAMNAMHSHNVFLSVFVETGIGGFVAVIMYMFKLFKSGLKTAIKTKDIEIKFYTAAAIASLTGFTIFALVEYVWFYPRVMLMFWMVAGIIFALCKMNDQEISNNA